MEIFNKRSALGFAAAFALCGSLFAGAPANMGDLASTEAGSKKKFEYQLGDATLTLGGKVVNENRFMKNAVMLNRCLPDEVAHWRTTYDQMVGFKYGEKKFGHDAIEFGATVRFKTMWGKVGHFAQTKTNEEFEVSDAKTGGHRHFNARPLGWFKEAWLQASLNAIFGFESDIVHTISIDNMAVHFMNISNRLCTIFILL